MQIKDSAKDSWNRYGQEQGKRKLSVRRMEISHEMLFTKMQFVKCMRNRKQASNKDLWGTARESH